MKNQKYKDIYSEGLAKDAILNEEFTGFKEDYLVLHCLLKKYGYKIKRFLEIGTNMGMGTLIIKNALGDRQVLTLDLPENMAEKSRQHPISEGKMDPVGHLCYLDYEQILCDSTTFDYTTIYPIDGAYIDGEHVYENVIIEAKAMIQAECQIVIFHDSDVPQVFRGIEDAFKGTDYTLYRVTDTRIAYALRK